jgi:protein-L-isoaspartate O-methyltransferase
MGSGYGYSTAWLARAVKENGGGTVHHVVWDEDLSKKARQHALENFDIQLMTNRYLDLLIADGSK